MVHLATGRDRAEAAQATLVTGRYFDVVGARPAAGRVLGPADDEIEGAHAVAVLSHDFWRSRYAGSADAIGRSLRINGRPYQIVGVTSRGFHGVSQQTATDVFLSLSMASDAEPMYRGQLGFASSAFFDAVGRLAPGATLEQAQLEADLVSARMGAGQPASSGPEAADPSWRHPRVRVDPASPMVAMGSRDLARMLWMAVLLVLLIAAVDAVSVLIARSDRRRKELAIRMALGSSRGQLVRERMAEGVWLAVGAGLLGTGFAIVITHVAVAAASEPWHLPLHGATDLLSLRVLSVGAALAMLAGIAASLVPVLRASVTDPITALKGDASAREVRRVPLRAALVVLQVALSLSLLVATALLLRSLQAADRQYAGLDVRSLVVGTLNLARSGYDVPRALELQESLRGDLVRLPGVQAVALSSGLPPFAGGGGTSVTVNGRQRQIAFDAVTPGFVRVVRWPILRGRDLVPNDTNAALVDAAAAEQLWPGENPLGKTIADFSPRRSSLEIVGVVRAARAPTRSGELRPYLLIPRAAFYGAFPWQPRTAVLVRTEGPPRDLMAGIAKAVEVLDPDLPLLGLRSAPDQLAREFADTRLLAMSFGALGAIALVLCAAGLFGVVASAVEARRREIGVRVALGALPSQILRLVLAYSTRLVVAGAVLAIPGAFALTRGLSSFLHGVTRLDEIAVVGALAAMATTALLAAYGPTRRALAVDPARVLRSD